MYVLKTFKVTKVTYAIEILPHCSTVQDTYSITSITNDKLSTMANNNNSAVMIYSSSRVLACHAHHGYYIF